MGLAAYAMVTMEDGSEKRAEDLAPGDALRKAMTGGIVTVRKVWQGPGVGMRRITASDGRAIDLTDDALIETAAGPVAAGTIVAGTVLTAVGGAVVCAEAAPLLGDYMVYDIKPVDADDARVAVNGLVVKL